MPLIRGWEITHDMDVCRMPLNAATHVKKVVQPAVTTATKTGTKIQCKERTHFACPLEARSHSQQAKRNHGKTGVLGKN